MQTLLKGKSHLRHTKSNAAANTTPSPPTLFNFWEEGADQWYTARWSSSYPLTTSRAATTTDNTAHKVVITPPHFTYSLHIPFKLITNYRMNGEHSKRVLYYLFCLKGPPKEKGRWGIEAGLLLLSAKQTLLKEGCRSEQLHPQWVGRREQ